MYALRRTEIHCDYSYGAFKMCFTIYKDSLKAHKTTLYNEWTIALKCESVGSVGL